MLTDSVIIDFITALNYCSSIPDCISEFSRILSSFGIEEFNYAMAFREDLQESFSISSYRQNFLDAYDEVGGLGRDISAIWCVTQKETAIWKEEHLTLTLSDEFMPVEDVSHDFSVVHGFTVPVLFTTGGCWGGVGLSATGIGFREFQYDIRPKQKALEAICALFDMKMRQMDGNERLISALAGDLKPLRKEEVETLKWLADGYSIKQIADEKVNRSGDSINIYIRGAKEKLCARSRDQLIARAVMLNII